MGFDFISKSFTFVKFGKSDTLTSHFTLWQLSQIFLAQRSQYLSWLKCLLRSATGVTSAQVSALLHQRSGLPEFLAWHVKTDWLARLLGPGYNRDQQLSCRQHQGCIVASDDTPVTMHHIPAPSSLMSSMEHSCFMLLRSRIFPREQLSCCHWAGDN